MSVYLLPYLLRHFRFLFRTQNVFSEQILLVITKWIFATPFLHQLLRHVFGPTGLLVSAHPEGLEFQQYRSGVLSHAFGQDKNLFIYFENVVSVKNMRFHSVTFASVGQVLAAVLLGGRG